MANLVWVWYAIDSVQRVSTYIITSVSVHNLFQEQHGSILHYDDYIADYFYCKRNRIGGQIYTSKEAEGG